MFYNDREKSAELKTLEELNVRMELTSSDKQHMLKLQKGFEGEVLFDHHLEKLDCDSLILRDLLLEINGRIIQIDTLPILYDTIYIFEVKNFEGNFFYDDGKVYKFPKHEIINPLNQLERTETYFRQLLHNIGFNFEIKAFVVFVNPAFTLYQAPLNTPFIFPTQIPHLVQQLSTRPKRLNQKHKALADKLLSLCLEDSPFNKIPSYNYNSLRKGIICKNCQALSATVTVTKCICENCGIIESVDEAVLRSISTFRLLFPEEKITRTGIQEWCGISSRRTISRILENNFKKVNSNRWIYYV